MLEQTSILFFVFFFFLSKSLLTIEGQKKLRQNCSFVPKASELRLNIDLPIYRFSVLQYNKTWVYQVSHDREIIKALFCDIYLSFCLRQTLTKITDNQELSIFLNQNQ